MPGFGTVGCLYLYLLYLLLYILGFVQNQKVLFQYVNTPTCTNLRLVIYYISTQNQRLVIEVHVNKNSFDLLIFLGFADETEMNQSLRENLCRLPDDNLFILSYLIHFLSRVAAHSQSNHMPVENLATIFGPCIFQ